MLDPQLVSRAERYVAGSGRSNDGCLKARRYLEHYWETDPACPPGGQEYRRAAHDLEAAGQLRLAEFFDQMAGTEPELQAADQAWGARYTAAADTAAETLLARQLSDGVIVPAGVPGLGVDGAWYQLGEFTVDAAEPAEPVVLVSTMTTRELVAGFTSEQAADGWMRDRSRVGEPRPLADPAVEHLPRVTLEEQVLAWMLRHPRRLPDIGTEPRARLWTADCRHEIDAALCTATGRDERAGPREVSWELQRRMLRAPGWAADQVGWPFGHWAQSYLQRLGATIVSEGAARRASQALALSSAVDVGVAGSAPRQPDRRTGAAGSGQGARRPSSAAARRTLAAGAGSLPRAARAGARAAGFARLALADPASAALRTPTLTADT